MELENPKWKNKKMLIVEDEQSNFKVVQSILKPTQIDVFWARNGVEALDLYKENLDSLNMVLMDIKLPGKSGIVVAQELMELKKGIPIIALTAYALPDEEQTIRKAGFDDYFSKPITRERILKIMTKHMV